MVVTFATTAISFAIADRTNGVLSSVVDNGITGRSLVALLELLVMLPTMVVAWVEVEDDGDELRRDAGRGRLAWLALPAVAAAWLVLMTAWPEEAAAGSPNTLFGMAGASCAQYAGGRIVGAQFGATVGMRVGVCWNGRDAFVDGDPSIPPPRSAIDGMNRDIPASAQVPSPPLLAQPEVTACGWDNLDDFAVVSATRCTGAIDAAGTLHYLVHARVAGPFGFAQRDIVVSLVVDRNGRVLERP